MTIRSLPMHLHARPALFDCVHPGRWLALLCSSLLAVAFSATAQPKSGLRFPDVMDKAEGERLGKAFVAELLAQKPAQDTTNGGKLVLHGPGKKLRTLAARFEIFSTPTNWVSVYETVGTNSEPGVRLKVVHSDAGPNQYWLSQVGAGAADADAQPLSAAQLQTGFAGSDFWIADLGLEFLRWPSQTVLRNQMRKNLSCRVLESVNPSPGPSGYSRIVSWVDIESGGIIHADAYDARGELLKTFDPTDIQKVAGQWQLQQMEIRNLPAKTWTEIIFDLGK